MFRRSGRESPTQANELILRDLERDVQNSINQDCISITQTRSDIVTPGMCCSVVEPPYSHRSLHPTDHSMMAVQEEEPSGHSRNTGAGNFQSESMQEEMTAIETILETPSDEYTSNKY